MSTRDQAYERVLILRQKVQDLLKELEELQELRNRTQDAKSLVGLAMRAGNSPADRKVRH